MNNKLSRYVCALWIMSAIFTAAWCISAALTGAISSEDFPRVLDALGSFLPVIFIVCLTGGLLLLVADLVIAFRHKKG